MKKGIIFLIICAIVVSCVNDVRRIPMEAYIFDSQTKKPAVNVDVVQLMNVNGK